MRVALVSYTDARDSDPVHFRGASQPGTPARPMRTCVSGSATYQHPAQRLGLIAYLALHHFAVDNLGLGQRIASFHQIFPYL